MKKIIALTLAALMLLSAGCAAQPQDDNTQVALEPTKVLENIWEKFGDNKFATYGGSIETALMDQPGALNMSGTDELTGVYLIPGDYLSIMDQGASLVHMMNSNIFTCAAVHVTDATKINEIYLAWLTNVQNNRSMCGQPDRVIIAQAGGCLVMAFGGTDAMSLFSDALTGAFSDANVLCNESVIG